MNTTHCQWGLALLAGFAFVAFAGSTQAAPPPGPPWPTNFASPKERPASDAPARDFAFAEIEANGAPIGVAVTASAAVAKPKLANIYELYYQFRVHTKKGDAGPLLGTPDSPNGKPFLLRQITCEHDWIEFYEKFDVTRKDISGMLNLPVRAVGGSDLEVLIRVEPQLYDVAEKKFITPFKTPAAILVAGVGANGKVWKVQSLSGWLIGNSRNGANPAKALDTLADLDDFSPTDNGVEGAFLAVLSDKEVSAETKTLYIGAIPPLSLNSKAAFTLKQALKELAAGDDAGLKAAARKKLDDANRAAKTG